MSNEDRIHNGCLECYGAGRSTCTHVPRENWTKGPWFVDPDDDNDIYGLDECGDAELLTTAYPMGEVENAAGFGPKQRANAKMLAAAPDLYEALKGLCEYYGVTTEPQPVSSDARVWCAAFAALAKARGEVEPPHETASRG